jgi:hypothetical protein
VLPKLPSVLQNNSHHRRTIEVGADAGGPASARSAPPRWVLPPHAAKSVQFSGTCVTAILRKSSPTHVSVNTIVPWVTIVIADTRRVVPTRSPRTPAQPSNTSQTRMNTGDGRYISYEAIAELVSSNCSTWNNFACVQPMRRYSGSTIDVLRKHRLQVAFSLKKMPPCTTLERAR